MLVFYLLRQMVLQVYFHLWFIALDDTDSPNLLNKVLILNDTANIISSIRRGGSNISGIISKKLNSKPKNFSITSPNLKNPFSIKIIGKISTANIAIPNPPFSLRFTLIYRLFVDCDISFNTCFVNSFSYGFITVK